MVTGDHPTLPEEPSDGHKHNRELLRFLRDENEANRKGLREDAEANRGLLLDALKITSYPLAALIAIAAFLGFKTFSDIRSQARSETKTEIQHMESEANSATTKEIAQLRSKSDVETNAEIDRMRSEIRKRLDDQFRGPAIREMVENAAKKYTEDAAQGLIKAEIEKQVTPKVNDAVDAAVKPKVNDAVDALVPQRVDAALERLVPPKINAVVEAQVGASINNASREQLEQIQKRLDLISPRRAQIRNPTYEFPPRVAGRPATVKASLKNSGDLEALNILIYSVARVSESTDDDSKRARIFAELTKLLQKSAQARQGIAGAPTPPNGTLTLTATTPALSEDQVQKLQDGENSLYFLYMIYYQDPKGGNWLTDYCGAMPRGGCKLPDNWIGDLHLWSPDVRGSNP